MLQAMTVTASSRRLIEWKSVLNIIHTQLKSFGREAFVAGSLVHHSRGLVTAPFVLQKCRERQRADAVFDEMPGFPRIWNSKMVGYCINGSYEESLSLFERMRRAGVRLNDGSFTALLKLCSVGLLLELGKSIHGVLIKEGRISHVNVAKYLLNMYAKCGSWSDSHQLFGEIDSYDTVLWNILMSAYAASQFRSEVFELLYSMHTWHREPKAKPSAITIAIILPVCAKLKALLLGMSVHAYAIKAGLETQTLVGNALVSLYAKCGDVVSDAYVMFSSMSVKDVVSWNAMIAGYIEKGFLAEAFETFCQMGLGRVEPNYATVANVLPVAAELEDWDHGREIHAYVLRRSFLVGDASVCNALMTFYSKMGRTKEVKFIFHEMGSRDLVSWNTVIAGSVLNGLLHEALEFYHKLLLTGAKPDSITFLSVLPVCAQLHDCRQGQKFHVYILKHAHLANDTAIGNALISFYSRCGGCEDALRAFNTIKRDLISWNTMLAACAESAAGEKLDLLDRMWKEKVKPDHVTILSLLKGCASFSVRGVKQVHSHCIRSGLLNEIVVGNAIIDMYAKFGTLEQAFRTFKSLVGKNVVTSNAMISGYVNQGCEEGAEMIFKRMEARDLTTWNLMVQAYAQNESIEKALGTFLELQLEGMKPDATSILSVLPVSAHLGSIEFLRQLHGYAVRSCLNDIYLEGALLDMYAKCGSVHDAYKLFQTGSKRDLVTFTAMIGGYAMHGMGKEALMVFSDMVELNMKPDHVVMTAVLSACSHAGLVHEGWKYFKSMEETYGIQPTMEHYSCMVDLLARSGNLKDAYHFIKNMPIKPNSNAWGTLLGSCKTHHDVELGRLAAKHLLDIQEDDIGHYVAMSNLYAADGKWDRVEEVRRLIKMKDLKKPPGYSSIEVDKKRHVFAAEDYGHPQRVQIYSLLKVLDKQSKDPVAQMSW